MKGAQGPTSIPLCLKQKENEIFVWLVHCQNPKCSIRPHRGSLASAVPNGCIAMEMCDTFVDELSVSRWTSSFPAPAFEKCNRPFFKYLLCTNCGLSKGLAGFFVLFCFMPQRILCSVLCK